MCSNKLSKHTILYVDDDPDDIQMLQDAVRMVDNNFHFLEANNGEEGIKQLENLKSADCLPCLIVLDINMPKMDGKQAFKKIRSDAALSEIPVVIFSTSNNILDKMFFKGNNVEYITKPVDFAHLMQVANKLLNYCN